MDKVPPNAQRAVTPDNQPIKRERDKYGHITCPTLKKKSRIQRPRNIAPLHQNATPPIVKLVDRLIRPIPVRVKDGALLRTSELYQELVFKDDGIK